MPSIHDSVDRVRERIADAAKRSGRQADDVTLIAVSKTVDTSRIREALAAGVADLGENYVQEALRKVTEIGPGPRWHFIGHLQSNKARDVVGRFDVVHSVESLSLVRELSKRAVILGIIQRVLVEVGLDTAPAKTGVELAQVLDFAAEVAEAPGLRLDGLMGIPPVVEDPDDARPYFAQLRRLFEQLPADNRRMLSMGMTGDFETAIEEGSTAVRIGTAIFGQRDAH